MKDHASGQGPGLDAIFVLARTGAPIVAVGEQQQPTGVVARGGDDEVFGGNVLAHFRHLISTHREDIAIGGPRLSFVSDYVK